MVPRPGMGRGSSASLASVSKKVTRNKHHTRVFILNVCQTDSPRGLLITKFILVYNFPAQ